MGENVSLNLFQLLNKNEAAWDNTSCTIQILNIYFPDFMTGRCQHWNGIHQVKGCGPGLEWNSFQSKNDNADGKTKEIIFWTGWCSSIISKISLWWPKDQWRWNTKTGIDFMFQHMWLNMSIITYQCSSFSSLHVIVYILIYSLKWSRMT